MADVQQNLPEGRLRPLLRTDDGRAKIAASMVQPIRIALDYQGIHRYFTPGHKLPEDAAIEEEAWLFSWSDDVHLNLAQMEHARRWAMLERMKDMIRVGCVEAITRAVLDYLDGMAGEPDRGPFDPWPGGALVMNAHSYAELRAQDWFTHFFESYDDRDRLRRGDFGNWGGMTTHCTRFAETDRVYRLGPPEDVGELHYNLELTYDAEESSEESLVIHVELNGRIVPFIGVRIGVSNVKPDARIG